MKTCSPLTFFFVRCRLTLMTCFAAVLVACGGGGGGNGDAPSARSWQTAQRLEDQAPTTQHHATAMGANGVGYAMWTQSVANQEDVFFSRYSGGVWSAPQGLPNENPVADAEFPQVVVHADGEATAVWSNDLLTGQSQVVAAHTVAGVWQAAFNVHTGAGAVTSLSLAHDGKGGVMATWTQGQTACASRGAHGKFFEAREQISEGTTAQATQVRVAMNTAGEALAVWLENRFGVPKVFYRPYVAGDWKAADELNADLPGNAGFPSVAFGLNGRAVVAWDQGLGAESGIAVRVASNAFTGNWGAVDTVATVAAFRSSVALDPAGGAMLAWQQNEFATTGSIFAARHDGTDWSPATAIEFDDSDHASQPEIAGDGSGNMYAVWRRSAGAFSQIEFNRFDARVGAWGQPQRIDNFTGVGSQFPLLAINAAGQGVAVWQISRPGGFDVAANAFR